MPRLFITCAKGVEEFLAEEIRWIASQQKKPVEIKPSMGGVEANCEGDRASAAELGMRLCLWSRLAQRVLLELSRFPAPDERKLYGGIKAVRWSDHLSARHTLAIDFSSRRSQITHTRFGAQKTKDAIVDQLLSVQGARPSIDLESPDLRFNVHLENDVATLSIDLSGESLHLRGYRTELVAAPLKETLAAAILHTLGFHHAAFAADPEKNAVVIDPMAGSGTFLIEAAEIACMRAPGLRRRKYGFTSWPQADLETWRQLRSEAENLAQKRKEAIHSGKVSRPQIAGGDRSREAVRVAHDNILRAALPLSVPVGHGDFQRGPEQFIELKNTGASGGLWLCNPPYGERLGEIEELKPMYKAIGDTLKKLYPGWKAGVFVGNRELANEIGLKTTRKIPLFNGPIECRLLTFDLYAGKKEGKGL